MSGYAVQTVEIKPEQWSEKILSLKIFHCIARNVRGKRLSTQSNLIYLLSKSQTHRRRADSTQGLNPCGYRLFFIFPIICPAAEKKKPLSGRLISCAYSAYPSGGFEKSRPPILFAQRLMTTLHITIWYGGKRRMPPCQFYFFIVRMLYAS